MSNQEGRWFTYAEVGHALGISTEAARQMARRRKWPRRTPNDYGTLAQVLMPMDAVPIRSRPASNGVQNGLNGVQPGYDRGTDQPANQPADHPDVSPDIPRTVRETVKLLLKPLREQLAVANHRAEAAEQRTDRAAQQIEALRSELAEARIAEQVAAAEAAELRRRLDDECTERRQTADRLAAAQERIAALLADQRAAPPAPAAAPRRSWLSWRRRS